MLAARRQELAEETVRQICEEVPGYESASADTLLDVARHVAENHDALRDSLVRNAPVRPEDFGFISPHAAARARSGVPLAAFLHAFRIGHRVLWDALVAEAGDSSEGRRTALLAARILMEFINHASTHAADAYLDAQQMLMAEGDRTRRDLLEDLLSGSEPATHASRIAAQEVGLNPSSSAVVVVAVRSAPIVAEALRSAVSSLVRAVGGAVRPLSVIRQDEIVIVRSLRAGDVGGLPDRMRSVQRELIERGVRLAIGVSTVHEGTAGLPAAYQEAREAAERVDASVGVLSLTELRPLDYFASREDQVAARLLSPGIRAFVERDLRQGGALIDTLLAYSESDMSLTKTAEALHVHVNTVRYRLARVAELTGSNVKRFNDVVDLVIAIKLFSAMRDVNGL